VNDATPPEEHDAGLDKMTETAQRLDKEKTLGRSIDSARIVDNPEVTAATAQTPADMSATR
jgi:hypothetical protein